MVGQGGQAVGVHMTPAMLHKARRAAAKVGLNNVEVRQGYAQALPEADGRAVVVMSNGVLNRWPYHGFRKR